LQRHQFEAYLDKVFDWRRMTWVMTEGRQDPQYPWSEAFDAVFLGSACRFGPLHRIERSAATAHYTNGLAPSAKTRSDEGTSVLSDRGFQ
jgi:hypothetical protein